MTLGPTGRIHVASLTGPVSLGGLTLDGGQFVVDGGISGPFHSGGLTIDRGGRLAVGGDLSGAFSAGALTLDGGQFLVGHDVSGPFSAGGISLQNGSLFSVGQDFLGTSTGGLNDTGNLTVGANSAIVIGHNLGELGVTQPYSLNVGQALSLNGGKLIVGNDVNAPIQVGSGLSVSNGGQLAVGRDLLPPGLAPVSSGVAPLAGLSVGGDLTLDSGGGLNVGRDLNGLNVNGDLRFTPSAGSIAVGGNLTNLTINGVFQGKGTAGIDLSVGLDLNGFTVHGGSPNLGGVHGANIDVGKSILGLDVRHGIFNSLITAGVSIGAGVIGPDGNDAVFDSQLLAGSSINLAFNGNIRSDWVTNPNHAGYRTRLVAGVTRQGVYSSGGALNAQISGALIDSVLAASVAPFGGNGMLPPTGYGIPVPAVSSKPGDKGNNTYDAPGGVTSAGNPTYTAPPYNAMLDPTIDDAVLPSGTITASVGGGVISTPHGANPDANDFAGFFAADTTNVGLGAPPKKS